MPKDNANPVVLAVEDDLDNVGGGAMRRRRGQKRNPPLGWREIAAISAPVVNGESDENDVDDYFPDNWGGYDGATDDSNFDPVLQKPEDRAVMLALADVAAGTPNGRGASLLRKAGVVVVPADSSTSGKKKNAATSLSVLPVVLSSPSSKPGKNGGAPSGGSAGRLRDRTDRDEIFDILRNIQDPEHPLTLEQLGVVSRNQIEVHDVLDDTADNDDDDDDDDEKDGNENNTAIQGAQCSTVSVRFTPTVPHCSMATLIGLSIRVKLLRSLPGRFKVSVKIEPGTHQSENSVNKQLADKERVCAALENPHLCKVVNRCIANGMRS